MAKDPAFLFYTNDFLTGIQDLTMEERGQYITLLCLQHQKGHLTEKMIRLSVGNAAADVMAKFRQDDDGLWYNVRLETEIDKRKALSESRKNNLRIDNGDFVNIYIIFDPATKTYKIGSSKYPELRLREAQKFKPEATFEWISEHLVERITEKELHDFFSEKRKRYDWFNLSYEDLKQLRTIVSNKYRTNTQKGIRTENENANGNEDVNGNEDKGVQGEKFTDAWFDRIFDSIQMEAIRCTFPLHNIENELKIFRLKVRGSPADYEHHDTGGIRRAFIYQLKTSKAHDRRNDKETVRRADATIEQPASFGTF